MAMSPQDLDRDNLIRWYCMYVPACVSLVACLYMLLTYALFKRIRTPAINLVMLQTISEILMCLAHNVAFYNPPVTGTWQCRFQGWFINLTLLSSLMFTTAISWYMNATLRRTRRMDLKPRNLLLLSLGIYGVCGFCAALPLISDQYAALGPRCWIVEDEEGRDQETGVLYRFLTFYAVAWVACIYMFYCYFMVIKYLLLTQKERQVQVDDSNMRRTINILMYYPVICFCVWVPHTVHRLVTAVHPSALEPLWEFGLTHVFLNLEGFMYAIAFSQYRVVRQEWTRYIFGGDKVSSSTPLTDGLTPSAKQGSNSNGSKDNNINNKGRGASPSGRSQRYVEGTAVMSELLMSSGFDVTTIDDIEMPAYSEMGELRTSEQHAALEVNTTSDL